MPWWFPQIKPGAIELHADEQAIVVNYEVGRSAQLKCALGPCCCLDAPIMLVMSRGRCDSCSHLVTFIFQSSAAHNIA